MSDRRVLDLPIVLREMADWIEAGHIRVVEYIAPPSENGIATLELTVECVRVPDDYLFADESEEDL